MTDSNLNLFVQVHITDNCNLRCSHCYIGDHLIEPRKQPDRGEVCSWLQKIQEFSSKRGFKSTSVGLTGGEPLFRKDIFEIVEFANSLGLNTILMTNGTLLNRNNAIKLRSCGIRHISFSLEGLKQYNDIIRGEGTFNRTIAAIKETVRLDISSGVSLTVCKSNFKGLKSFLDYIGALVHSVQVREVLPIGNAQPSDTLTRKQRHLLYKIVRNYNQGQVNVFCEDPCICSIENGPAREFGCSAFIHYFCIDVDGSLYPCRLLPIKVGTVWGIMEAWESEIASNLRSRKVYKGRCNNCVLLNHCGGCRAYTYAKGDLYAEDDRCFIDHLMVMSMLKKILPFNRLDTMK